jgi:predicted  nucleic acid-binding Zn-ribbon protein
MREATAATAQLEQAKRMIDEDERELSAIGQRLVTARKLADDRSRVVSDLEVAQAEKHASLSADQAAIEGQIAEARTARNAKATAVPRALLSTYDRIRSRRPGPVVYPLRGPSCANCDTMIPLQRRSSMVGTGATVICEGCGVMLYAAD